LLDQWEEGLRQNKTAGLTHKFDTAKAVNTECNLRQLQCMAEFITVQHSIYDCLVKGCRADITGGYNNSVTVSKNSL